MQNKFRISSPYLFHRDSYIKNLIIRRVSLKIFWGKSLFFILTDKGWYDFKQKENKPIMTENQTIFTTQCSTVKIKDII